MERTDAFRIVGEGDRMNQAREGHALGPQCIRQVAKPPPPFSTSQTSTCRSASNFARLSFRASLRHAVDHGTAELFNEHGDAVGDAFLVRDPHHQKGLAG